MRIAVASSAFLLLALSACHHRPAPTLSNRPPYDCVDPVVANPASGYTAVKKKPHGSKCEVTWDLADATIAADPHPEIGVLLSRNDEVKFKHSGHKKFHYAIRSDPGGNAHPPTTPQAEDGCDDSPFKDGHAGDADEEHAPGALHLKSGANECHYKLTFYLDDGTNAIIDPHIVVGRQ